MLLKIDPDDLKIVTTLYLRNIALGMIALTKVVNRHRKIARAKTKEIIVIKVEVQGVNISAMLQQVIIRCVDLDLPCLATCIGTYHDMVEQILTSIFEAS